MRETVVKITNYKLFGQIKVPAASMLPRLRVRRLSHVPAAVRRDAGGGDGRGPERHPATGGTGGGGGAGAAVTGT